MDYCKSFRNNKLILLHTHAIHILEKYFFTFQTHHVSLLPLSLSLSESSSEHLFSLSPTLSYVSVGLASDSIEESTTSVRGSKPHIVKTIVLETARVYCETYLDTHKQWSRDYQDTDDMF